jgi:flavodoxin
MLGCLAGCGSAAPLSAAGPAAPEPAPAPEWIGPGARVLLAYFSRAGENYYYGGRTYLQVGNTEVLAGMISAEIACDLHRIEAAEPYSDDYEDTVARNVREQQVDARPPIANPLPTVDGYDVVLLGSGLWNVRPPMIMRTFAEGLDLRGKTVLPVITYAVSGIGSAPDVYEQACPGATVGEGIAVRGEEVARSGPEVTAWLDRVGLRQPA